MLNHQISVRTNESRFALSTGAQTAARLGIPRESVTTYAVHSSHFLGRQKWSLHLNRLTFPDLPPCAH